MKKHLSLFTSITACAALSACGSSTGGLSDIPELAPLVQASLPSSLQISGTQNAVSRFDFSPFALGQSHLEVLFKTGSYGKLSGGNGSGYINALLEDLDYRFSELKTRFESNAPTCYSNTPQAHEMDFSALGSGTTSVTAMLKLSLDLQCYDLFSSDNPGEQSGSGSGMIFGKNGDDYSLGLLLNSQTESNSAFSYFAKVTDKGATTEKVDLIFAESRPVGSSTNPNGLSSIARIMAQPQSQVYEMAIAASDGSRGNPISGGSPNISCGFHGITNGTLVYIKAIDQAGGSTTCSAGYTTELCLSATDLTASAGGVSDCATIKAAMTIGTSSDIDDWDYNDVTVAKSSDLYTAMLINTTTIQGKSSSTSD